MKPILLFKFPRCEEYITALLNYEGDVAFATLKTLLESIHTWRLRLLFLRLRFNLGSIVSSGGWGGGIITGNHRKRNR